MVPATEQRAFRIRIHRVGHHAVILEERVIVTEQAAAHRIARAHAAEAERILGAASSSSCVHRPKLPAEHHIEELERIVSVSAKRPASPRPA